MVAPAREGEILDGKYRILRKLGEGGMGAVYAGEHIKVKRSVAIKILHAGASANPEMADRFEREAQAAGQIGNDHIVEVFDLGVTAAGERFMVMEYLEGESLRTRIRRKKRLAGAEIVPLMVQMLEGLEAAHAAGIIHRDLKPDNLFLIKARGGQRGEFVKILDFGISKFTALGEGSTTRTGTVMGSPNYMSPEHVRSSSEVDQKSDLYAVGIMLFEAVTGAVPRKAANFAELLFKIAYEPLPDPRQIVPDLDPGLCAIILRACATERDVRFASARELAHALSSLPLAPPAPAWDSGAETGFTPSSARIPAASVSQQGAISNPSFASVAGASQPGFSSSPGHAVPPEGLGSGTEILNLDAVRSQPSFNSQPSYGSQPNFASGSQPSYASVPSTAGGMLLPVDAAPPKRRGPVLALVLAAAAIVTGAGLYLAYLGTHAPKPASAALAPQPSQGGGGTTSSSSASSPATAAAVESAAASAEPIASTAAPNATASASSAPSSKPKVVVPRIKGPDPGY